MHSSDDSDPLAWLVWLTLAAVILAVLISGRLILMEAGRVYRANAGSQRRTLLWLALAGLIALLGVALLLATVPAMVGVAPWLASLAFLAWALAIELIDWRAPHATTEASLDDVLGPWRFHAAPSQVSGNGKTPVGAAQ